MNDWLGQSNIISRDSGAKALNLLYNNNKLQGI